MDDGVDLSIQEDKENIRKEIDAKMRTIHNMFFDLSDDEINAIQETIENDDDGEDFDVDLFHGIIDEIISEESVDENASLDHTDESMQSSSTESQPPVDSNESNEGQQINEETGDNDNSFSGL